MKKLGYVGLSTVLCLAFALPGLAQQAPSPADAACTAKYGKYYTAQADIKLFDDFVNDPTCKDNQYRVGAYSLLFNSMKAAKNVKGMMDVAIRFEKEMPTAPQATKVYYYNESMAAATQAGDAAKVLELADKILALDPANINALLIVATTIPLNLPTEPAALEKALAKALDCAKKLVEMTRPAAIEDKVWQTVVLGPAHGVIGFVYLNRNQYEEAEAEYAQAVKINPKDQMSWYRYGVAALKIAVVAQNLIDPAYKDVNDNFRTLGPERDAAIAKRDAIEKDYTDKRDKTIDRLISATALPDTAISKAARATLESLYNPLHSGTNAGLDDLIAARKAELNK